MSTYQVSANGHIFGNYTEVHVGGRVEAGEGDDHDTGRVESIEGDTAFVAWDSGVKTPAHISLLSPL